MWLDKVYWRWLNTKVLTWWIYISTTPYAIPYQFTTQWIFFHPSFFTPVISRGSLFAVHPLQFLAVLPSILRWGIQVEGTLTLAWSSNAGHTVWGVVAPGPLSPYPPVSVGVPRALQWLWRWRWASVMLVGVVMAASVVATAMVAPTGGWGRWLAGAGWVVVGGSRCLGQKRFPGALQDLQLQALLSATAPQGHPSFPSDGINPRWLICNNPLWASCTWWVLCRQATFNRESTFGRAWRYRSLWLRL